MRNTSIYMEIKLKMEINTNSMRMRMKWTLKVNRRWILLDSPLRMDTMPKLFTKEEGEKNDPLKGIARPLLGEGGFSRGEDGYGRN